MICRGIKSAVGVTWTLTATSIVTSASPSALSCHPYTAGAPLEY